jgi:hypothetical protein
VWASCNLEAIKVEIEERVKAVKGKKEQLKAGAAEPG